MTQRTETDILREIDPGSPTFKAVMELVAVREAQHTKALRVVGLDQNQTEALRGRLDELEKLKDLGEQVRKLPPLAPHAAPRS